MEDRFDAASEPKKEWVAPELKKIDVEEITASGGGPTFDGVTSS
jgi:hypothetical protein